MSVSWVRMVILFCFSFIAAACSNNADDAATRGQVIARVNDYSLSLEEFRKGLVREMEYARDFKATAEVKTEFLQSLIKKELLIQEAKRRGLDTREEFVDAIEAYWEATLIKQLMEEKNREIKKVALVSEKEIQERYAQLKSENPTIPAYELAEKQIAEELYHQKKTRLLDQWISSLQENAAIEINSELLNE